MIAEVWTFDGFFGWIAKCVAVTATIIGSGTIIFKSPVGRFLRWMYVRLWGEPAGAWMRKQVGQVVDEKLLARNGGTTVPDAIERIEKLDQRMTANHRVNVERLDAIEARLGHTA